MTALKTIGMIFEGFSNGGIERVATYLIPLFQKMGLRVIALTDIPPSANEYPLDFTVERVTIGRPGKDSRVVAIAEAVKNYKIDLVIDHEYYVSPHALLRDLESARGALAKFVIHHHSVFSEKLLRERLEHLFYPLLHVYRKADAIITLSRVNDCYFRAVGCTTAYIPNPVPSVSILPRSRENKERIVLWIGRFTQVKRPEEALSVFRIVNKAVPASKLIMLGDYRHADKIVRKKVERILKQYPSLQSSIEIVGFDSDVFKYLGRAALLISTSSFEGNPGVIIEAKAAGVPIVCYDMPYVESIRDSRGVLVSKQGDISGLAKLIVKLLMDESQRQIMAEEARKSYEAMVQYDFKSRYKEFFSGVMNQTIGNGPVGDVSDYVIALSTLSEHVGIAISEIMSVRHLYRRVRRCVVSFLLNVLRDQT